jgi:multicomponent Na+:H+ antiporter subunit D
MDPIQWLPVTVLLPLGVAALLLAAAPILPPRIADVTALATSLSLILLCGWLAHDAQAAPIVHWFGGWVPDTPGADNVIIGISFRADAASASIAAFVSLMFFAAFVFSWGYFDNINSHFHILMLLFLAGMVGFCLTGDLFNMFVWFELMSVSAFALNAYPLGESALDGAFNFIVTNAIAGFMFLAAIGLVYARTGTLDMLHMGTVVQGLGRDPVIIATFVLIAAALLTKAAIVPFHFWLSDAHAVAPSPVSVIFSGAMVSVGLFGFTKLVLLIFAKDTALIGDARPILIAMGGATAVVAGLTAWAQRHVKRLLAFSTISHLGIMLTGVATLAPAGVAGFTLYMIGHGLVKGALFMIAGVVLALLSSGDEITLYAEGRRYWPAGVVMVVGGLMLAGLPLGPLHAGDELIHRAVGDGPAGWAISIATIFTGAAVIRAALRIFAGWSGVPSVEANAPTERERERNDRPFWLMLTPCAVLIALSLVTLPHMRAFAGSALATMTGNAGAANLPPPPSGPPWEAISTVAIALGIVAIVLVRTRPVRPFARRLNAIERAPFGALQFIHSGLVGDYASWTALGLAALAAWLGLR